MHKYGHDIVFAWHNNNNETEQPHYPTKIYIVIPDTASTSIGEYIAFYRIFILNPVEN